MTPTNTAGAGNVPSVRKITCGLLSALAIALAVPSAGLAASYTFTPVADTYTRSDLPTTNFGDGHRLSARNHPLQVRHAYLRFDVDVPADETITGATLRMYATTDGSSIDLHALADDSWAEDTLTWDSAPQHAAASVDHVDSVSAYASFPLDASSLVSANGAVSMVLTSDADSMVRMISRENASHRPRLIVETALAGTTDAGTADPGTTDPETTVPAPEADPGIPVLGGLLPCTVTLSPGDAIGAAADDAPPGAVVCLHGGTYVENVAINSAGTSSSPKTLRSVTGEHATIQPPTGLSGEQYALRVRSTAAFWRFEDVTFRNGYVGSGGCSDVNAWVIAPAHDITFDGAEFTGSTGGSGFLADPGTSRIYIYRSSSHDNVDEINCNGVQAHGFYFQSTDGVIANSLAYNHPDGGWGIQAYPLGDGNTLSQNTLVGNAGGAFVAQQTNLEIVNNIGWNNGASTVAGTGGSGCAIRNNILNGTSHPSSCSWTGNEDVDPMFVSSTDFHLQATSPAVGAAVSPTYSPDFDRAPGDSLPELGAYERP